MSAKVYNSIEKTYQENIQNFWTNLAHINSLLAIMNISLFFLTGLVTQGYYFTFYSLALITTVALLALMPVPFYNRAWYYLMCLTLEGIAIYFLVSSVIYWVQTSN